jgi:hypothetical protein
VSGTCRGLWKSLELTKRDEHRAKRIVATKVAETTGLVEEARLLLARGPVAAISDEDIGREKRDTKLQYLGFLSRYEETKEQKEAAETYRLVVTTEEEFLRFIKKWAAWVAKFRGDMDLSEAA